MDRAIFESSDLLRSVINSLTSHIAVTDHTGKILFVNQAWSSFPPQAHERGTSGVGSNYFDVCKRADGPHSIEANAVLNAMHRILAGEINYFELEYPCHFADEQRWFVVRITPFCGVEPRGLVVSHTNVTARKHSEAVAEELRDESTRQDRQDRDDRENRSMTNLSGSPVASVTAHAVGLVPLSKSQRELFTSFTELYGVVLDKAVENRVVETQLNISQELKRLAEKLGRCRAGPRDVVDIHLAALKARYARHDGAKRVVYAEEGRVVVLELMGNLASHYQKLSVLDRQFHMAGR